ncbi:MAG: EhaD family protein [Methanomicrobiaceae archaeon]|nr:EhaD family protein [Methanomicrobiaceae archaeon]
MILYLQLVFGLMVIGGAAVAVIWKNPFNKLIAMGIVAGGIMPFIAERGYLDVIILVSLIIPLSTIILLRIVRGDES